MLSFNVSPLDVHALHDSVEVCALVTDLFSVHFGTLTKLSEILTSFGAVFIEELNDHLLLDLVNRNVEVDVGSPWGIVNCVSEGISCLLPVNNIVGFIEQLSEVDTDNVEPLANVARATLPLRQDEITDGECRDKVLFNAPESEEGFFGVPKVVE